MAKLWKILKVIIFSVGALTLALIAYGLISTFVSPLFKSTKQHLAEAPVEETVYEKKDGAMKLIIKSKETESAIAYLLTVTKDNKTVVQNYRLPLEKYDLAGVSFYDAVLIPFRENEFRIILFSSYEGDEGVSDSHVWFLKMSGAMNVREVMRLSNIHRSEDNGLTITGAKYIGMPYQQLFHSEAFVVPIMVRVRDSIHISPALSAEGTDALHASLEQEIRARMAAPSESSKEEKLGDQYQTVRKELNEALSERTIDY